MTLGWKKIEPKPNPFESAVGDDTAYEVHYANSISGLESDISRDLKEVLYRGLMLARKACGPCSKNFLMLWDSVYCTLTIVLTDESMMLDYPKVTKCSFESIDKKLFKSVKTNNAEWESKLKNVSRMMKNMLIELLENTESSFLPVGVPVYFSDQERNNVDNFSLIELHS